MFSMEFEYFRTLLIKHTSLYPLFLRNICETADVNIPNFLAVLDRDMPYSLTSFNSISLLILARANMPIFVPAFISLFFLQQSKLQPLLNVDFSFIQYCIHYQQRLFLKCASKWDDSVRSQAVLAGSLIEQKTGLEIFSFLETRNPIKIGFEAPAWI